MGSWKGGKESGERIESLLKLGYWCITGSWEKIEGMSVVVRDVWRVVCLPLASRDGWGVGEDVGGRRWRGFKLKDTFKILVSRFLCKV